MIGLLLLAAADGEEYFESKVRPLLAANCYGCHAGKVKMAGLDLTDGASFARVVPEARRLLEILDYRGRVKMPPAGKLSEEALAVMRAWVERGAPWPKTVVAREGAGGGQKGKDHWAFQPLRAVTPPAVQRAGWVRKPLDRFVLAALEANGLEPAAPADRRTLLRRLSFDLTGLPPTPEEMKAFLEDASLMTQRSGRREVTAEEEKAFLDETLEQALARAVDRLLASPRYGEKWGRHWLDVARYADSTGMDEDHLYPHAWRYRDWVVKALNEDKPFDRFVVEQLAGDLVEGANNETVVATGFLALGPKPLAQQDRVKMIYDVVDEQIDTTTKALLGLTVACARCHDHKFDPITTRDYYSLASIFASTRAFRNLGRPGAVSYIYYTPLDREAYERWQAHRRRMDELFIAAEEKLAEDHCRRGVEQRRRLADYLVAAWEVRTRGKTARAVDWAVLEKFLCLEKLAIWREANDANIGELARRYAEGYEKQAHQWEERLARWLQRYKEEVIQDRDRPGKPVFDPVDDPFFHALTFGDGPLALDEPAEVKALRVEIARLKAAAPPEPPMASAVADGEMVEQRIFVRGDHHQPGAVARKGFPAVLAGEVAPVMKGSGRRELAEWIASPRNPLTARVIVNRVWQWHFGEGLVRTPNNWGLTGEKPTHPELLDYLAGEFIRHGWSLKWLHREMVLSATYGMSARATAEARVKDPSNRLLSRFGRRRLTVEEMRDAMLAVSGALDETVGGSLLEGDRRQRRQSFDEITRRTLYLPVRRGSIPTLLAMFDFGDASTASEGRSRTNVAPQALFFRNSPFVHERARELAERVRAVSPGAAGVRYAYELVLSREPTGKETDEALTFIRESGARWGGEAAGWASFCRLLLASNEFLYVN
jgi:cytochrome c553